MKIYYQDNSIKNKKSYPKTSKEIVDVISNINNDLGTTVIMATHDKDIVNKMKKRVLVINNGMLVGDYKKGSYKSSESI